MTGPSFKKWLLRCGLSLTSLSLWAQDAEKPPPTQAVDSPWQEIEKVVRLPQITDNNGCRWGLIKSGTIRSSNHASHTHQTFIQAAQLLVNDQPYEPELVEEHRHEPRWRMTQTTETLKIQRDIWLDAERGGARYIDSVQNLSDSKVTVKMQMRILFDECVESIHPLGAEAILDPHQETWAKNTSGWLIKPEDPQMRTSVMMITHDPRRKILPKLSLLQNNNLQTWNYDLVLPAKEKRAWLSWLIQRPALMPQGSAEVAHEFWRDGRLVRPHVDEADCPSLVNFTVKSHPHDNKNEAWLGYLQRPLHELAESTGHNDSSTDWVQLAQQTNLTGEIQGGAVTLTLGERDHTIPWEHIVALDQRNRPNSLTQLWLHDGSRFVGTVSLTKPWKLISPQGWNLDLPLSPECFFYRARSLNSTTPTSPACLHTSDEQIWLLSELPTAPQTWQTHWGHFDLSWVDIIFAEREVSTGLFSLTLRDGSQLQALPISEQWNWTVQHLGSLSLHPARLQSWYQAEAVLDENLMTPSAERLPLNIKTAPAGPGCLLRGGTFLRAQLAEETISLALGSTTASVPVTDIISIERLESSTTTPASMHTMMTLTFKNAPPVTGRLLSPELKMRFRGHPFTMPVSSLILYRQL